MALPQTNPKVNSQAESQTGAPPSQSTAHIFRLDGRRALVTGGSKGIGFAAAQLMRELGAEVTIAARTESELREAAQTINAQWVVADVSTAEGVQAALDAAGKIDILVANAGGPPPSLPSETSEKNWEAGYHTNFLSTVRLCEGALPHMRQQQFGRIIAITSMAVSHPALKLPVSNAMRAAVTNYLRTLALEVAAEGITCNTVAPGYTHTERLERLHPDEQGKQKIRSNIPMRRFGKPEELAAAIAYLASEAAGYMTAQELLLDGGYSI